MRSELERELVALQARARVAHARRTRRTPADVHAHVAAAASGRRAHRHGCARSMTRSTPSARCATPSRARSRRARRRTRRCVRPIARSPPVLNAGSRQRRQRRHGRQGRTGGPCGRSWTGPRRSCAACKSCSGASARAPFFVCTCTARAPRQSRLLAHGAPTRGRACGHARRGLSLFKRGAERPGRGTHTEGRGRGEGGGGKGVQRPRTRTHGTKGCAARHPCTPLARPALPSTARPRMARPASGRGCAACCSAWHRLPLLRRVVVLVAGVRIVVRRRAAGRSSGSRGSRRRRCRRTRRIGGVRVVRRRRATAVNVAPPPP